VSESEVRDIIGHEFELAGGLSHLACAVCQRQQPLMGTAGAFIAADAVAFAGPPEIEGCMASCT